MITCMHCNDLHTTKSRFVNMMLADVDQLHGIGWSTGISIVFLDSIGWWNPSFFQIYNQFMGNYLDEIESFVDQLRHDERIRGDTRLCPVGSWGLGGVSPFSRRCMSPFNHVQQLRCRCVRQKSSDEILPQLVYWLGPCLIVKRTHWNILPRRSKHMYMIPLVLANLFQCIFYILLQLSYNSNTSVSGMSWANGGSRYKRSSPQHWAVWTRFGWETDDDHWVAVLLCSVVPIARMIFYNQVVFVSSV